jgi:hypothetical protein
VTVGSMDTQRNKRTPARKAWDRAKGCFIITTLSLLPPVGYLEGMAANWLTTFKADGHIYLEYQDG